MSRAWIRSHRLWITLAVFVLLGLGYTVFGFYGVPRLADRAIRDQVAKLGLEVELGALHFHPFKFEAQVEGLHLREPGGALLLGFARLDVDLELWPSIRERGAVLQHLRIDAPDVSAVVEPDGKLNLAKLAPPPSAEPKPETDETSATIPHLRIREFTVSEGRVGVEDRSRPKPFATELRPVTFSLSDFRTDLNHANVYEFSGAARTGERIAWSGEFTVQPLESNGKFSIDNVQASTATAYLQDLLPVRLVSGVAQTAGEYRLRLDPKLDIEVSLPRLQVRDVGLAEFGARDAKPSLAVGEIAIADIAVSVARRVASVGGVDLRGVRAKLHREADGTINLTRLVAPAKAEAEKKTPAPQPQVNEAAPAASPWRATVGAVRIHAAALDVRDETVEPAIELAITPVDLEVGALASDLAQPLALKLGAGIGKAGRIDANGELNLEALGANVSFETSGLDLSILQPYLAPHIAARLDSGLLGAKGEVKWAREPAKLGFEGSARLADFALRDPERRRGDLLGWRELRVDGIAYSQQRKRLDIARIDLVAPQARVEISAERQINVVRAFAPPGEPPPAPAPAAESAPASAKADAEEPAPPALAVELKSLRIEDGLLDFADRSIEPRFAAAIQKLAGRIDGLSTRPDAMAKVDLAGQVDAFSPVLIQGELIPFAYDRDTTLAMSFRNMDLIRFNPYSGRFAGYNIVKGKLTTDLKYRIEKRALQAEHHVVVDQLEFGDATGSKDAVPLPVKLAVAVLKDRHGKIDLSLPVAGNLDDPTFRVGPVVWKVLVNLMAKAVTAPFAALGSLFGGNGEELQYVSFAPGEALIDDQQAQELGKLAKALVERPQLRLDVPYALSDEADGPVLARAQLDRLVANAKKKPPEDDGERLDRLEDLHKERLGAKPVYPVDAPDADKAARTAARIVFVEAALLEQLKPRPAAMEALANDRARAVQTVLLAQPELAPERLFLTSRRTGGLDNQGRVRMELKLE